MTTLGAVLALVLVPLVVVVSGPAEAQPAAGRGSPVTVPGGSYTNVGPSTLQEMLQSTDVFLLNVHVPYEGEIAGTDASVPFDRIEESLGQLPSDRKAPLVVYCRSGRMSTVAVETLVRLGYTNVWHLAGGFVAWQEAGYPLIRR